jgi:thiazole synthase
MMPLLFTTLSLLVASATSLSATATRRSPLTVAPQSDQLVIAGKTFNSRLFLGTGKYRSAQDMADSVEASGAEVVTVAVRRVEGAVTSMLETSIDWNKVWLLPNTAGCTTAEDAVRVARLGKEVARNLGQEDNNFVKLEVITDSTYLLPDPVGTLAAARQLVSEGFAVLPYCSPDPVLCRHLEDIGCATVMPLGSPIGSGQGIDAQSCIRVIVEQANIPVVVDAGLRCPSDAALAMELGADAVLANSAVARADDAPAMARAFKLATEAGRLAYTARPMAISQTAVASSPLLEISK